MQGKSPIKIVVKDLPKKGKYLSLLTLFFATNFILLFLGPYYLPRNNFLSSFLVFVLCKQKLKSKKSNEERCKKNPLE